MTTITAYIGLGSNLGDRAGHLRRALEKLAATDRIEVRAVSPVIETEPQGPPGQGRYLNAAACLTTTLAPRALLEVLLAIEHAHGRRREGELRLGPRTLDLDLLLYGDRIIDEPGLTVPHPRLHERLFVLDPLAAIAPQTRHPGLGETIECLRRGKEGTTP